MIKVDNGGKHGEFLFFSGLADYSCSAWSVACLALCTSGVQCKLYFIKAIQELLEIFLHVTLGSCPDLLVLQNTRVISADVMRL